MSMGIKLNNKLTHTMVRIWATHNFARNMEAKIRHIVRQTQTKMISSKATLILGASIKGKNVFIDFKTIFIDDY